MEPWTATGSYERNKSKRTVWISSQRHLWVATGYHIQFISLSLSLFSFLFFSFYPSLTSISKFPLSIDSLGLHRVENPSHVDRSVSLHLYSPPFETCQMFDQRTGKKTQCKVTFWSKFGERLPTVWIALSARRTMSIESNHAWNNYFTGNCLQVKSGKAGKQ